MLVCGKGRAEGGEAAEAPAGDGHLFDNQLFGEGGGGELGDESLVQPGELGGVFAPEADSAGKEAGTGVAFGRDRPWGLFPVGTGGGEATRGGCHRRHEYRGRGQGFWQHTLISN